MNRTLTPLVFAFGTSSLLLMDSAIKGSVILLGAACLAVMLKRDSAAMRHLVWLVAIVAMLFIPVFSVLLPRWQVLPAWAAISQSSPAIETPTRAVELPRPFEAATAESPEQFVQAEFDSQSKAIDTSFNSEAVAQARLDATQNNVGVDRVPSDPSWSWMSGLPILWSIGFGVLILRLMAARWILWSNEQRATVIAVLGCPNDARKSIRHESDAAIAVAFETAHRQLGIHQRVKLLIDLERTIPVVWGIVWFRLMLPDSARQWSSEQLRSVLLHELAHIKRRDTIVQLLAQIVCALHWFNPLVWFAAWRLHVERERACDDLVLAQGVRASAYAEHLLNVATKLSVARWTSACGLAMASHSPLESRLHAILSDRLNRRKVSTAIGMIGLLLGAGVAIPIAMLRAADEKWKQHSADVGGKDFSAYCVHDGKDASFVIAYHGEFISTTTVSLNAQSHTWTNSGTITVKKSGIAFSFHRTHTSPGKLSITTAPAEGLYLSKPAPPRGFGQREYDLARGRVFLLMDNGIVRQLDIATPVVTDQASAKKLAALIAAIPPQEREDVALTTNLTGKLAPETIAKLKWGEPVNGLRMALAYPPALGDALLGKKPHFELVVQNVTEKEIHFLASDEAPNPRRMLIREGERPVQGLRDHLEVSPADWKLQPGECGVLRLFATEESDKAGTIPSSAIESDLSKIGRYHAVVQMEIAKAPPGAWMGKLVTGQTRGSADVAAAPAPIHKDARTLYEVWQRYARANGDIPGALLGELAAAVTTFIRYNPTWETVPKLNAILPRLDATHDWKSADAIALLDEVAGIQDSPLKGAAEKATRSSIRKGEVLPKKYAKVRWGDLLRGGTAPLQALHAAWVLEPDAAEHRLGEAVKARLLVQNQWPVPFMVQVPTFHQGGVKATDAKGAEVEVSGIDWTTRAQLVPVRLAPGEYIEINTPGIGFGPRGGMGPWAGPRVGSNVLAKPGDELTLTYSLVPLDGSEVGVSEDDPHVSGPSWWLAHIKTRLNRELPLPADAAERTRLLDRAVRELFATAPTAEETAAFIADQTPDALDALAKRLATRVDVVSFSGKLPTAPAKFRVLAADANADKQPRVVLGPGEYPLPSASARRGDATLKIIGRPVGDRRTNDAQLIFEATEFTGALPPDPHKLDVPDGWGTWAIVCRPSDGFFYLLHKGTVRKIDYSAPRKVTDTPAIDLPAEFRDEVKRQLDIHEISAAQQAEIFEKPAAPAATPDSKTGAHVPASDEALLKPKHASAQSLLKSWQRYARSDGKIPGGLVAALADVVDWTLWTDGWLTPKDADQAARLAALEFTHTRVKVTGPQAAPYVAKLTAVRSRMDGSHDWTPAEAVAMLDELTTITTEPVHLANRPFEFDESRKVSPGKPLPKELESAAWGKPAENGLRVAWLLEPAPAVAWASILEHHYPLGSVLKARVLFHNAGKTPIFFQTEAMHQHDEHNARDAKGAAIKLSLLSMSGESRIASFRLAPGEYSEVTGGGIAIGSRAIYEKEFSVGSYFTAIEAVEGDEVTFSSNVEAIHDDWSRPGDPKAPLEFWKKTIAERIANEAPMPASSADREQLIRRVTLDIFGVVPTAEEIAAFTADETPDALAKLTARLQAKPRVEPFSGKLPTGETKFRVIAADPDAAKAPRTANAPGRYVLGEGVHLQITQTTVNPLRGGDFVPFLQDTATIIFPAPKPEAARGPKPHEIALPNGIGTYGIVWERDAGVLWVLQKDLARKYDFTDPWKVQETRFAEVGITNIPKHLREAMKKAFDVPVKPNGAAEKPAGASAPKLPKLSDDAYAKPGVHCQKFREEDAMRPGGELMGGVLEPSQQEDREKQPLLLGVRTASDAQWRIGGTARVGLVVRNRTGGIGRDHPGSDVKFSYTGRLDNGLSVVAVDEAGKEHAAAIAPIDSWLTFQHMLLPVSHVATIKEFTIRFDAEKLDVSESHVAAFHLPPGKYRLRCKWNDARPDVAHEGEWTGELMNEELKFTLAAAAEPATVEPKSGAPAPQAIETEKPKTTATELQPKAPDQELFTAWGKEVGGLQAGLGFRAGEKRAYTHGETVDLVLRVRNVGKEMIKFSYFRDEFYENPPVATDDLGKSVHIEGAGLDGEPNRIELNLAPGKEVDLSEINLGLRPASEKGKLKPAWKLFGTGKFQLQCERVAGNFEDRVNGGPDPILSKLATGKLELEVKEDLTAWGKEVDGLQAGYCITNANDIHIGGRVNAVVKLRNVSKETISVSAWPLFMSPARVVDSLDKSVRTTNEPIPSFEIIPAKLTLKPGQTVDVGKANMNVVALNQDVKVPGGMVSMHTIHVEPGKYKVDCIGFVQEHSDLGTGTVEFEVKAVEELFTAWGQEVGGLQAGLGFKAGEKRAYTHGETATLVVRVRNVGKEEVKFEYLRPFFDENSPIVTDGEGKPVALGKIFIQLGKRHIPVEVNLAAGKEIELYELKLEISSGTGLGIRKFPTIFGTGKFQVQYEKVLGNSSSGSIKLDPALSKLATGKLKLEIKPAALVQPAKGKWPQVRQSGEWSEEFLAHSKTVAEARGTPAAKPEDLIAWGKDEQGLRTGLLMVPRVTLGAQLSSRMVLRNVSNEVKELGLSISLNRLEAIARTPDGKSLDVHKVVLLGTDASYQVTLKPGEQVEFEGPPVQFGLEQDVLTKMVKTPEFPVCGVDTSEGKVLVHFSVKAKTGEAEVEVVSGQANQNNEKPQKEVPAKKDETPAADEQGLRQKEKLQGSWQVVEAHVGGTHAPRESSEEQVWTFTRDKLAFDFGDSDPMEMTYRIDEKHESATIDLSPLGPREKGNLYKGIYELDGDQLKVHFNRNSAANARPTEFKQSDIRGMRYFVLKRAPKPDAPADKDKEPFTAWGKEVGGLQAGLGFKAGENRVYTHGEWATLVVRVRNVGKEEVKFQYLRQFFVEQPPTVFNEKGELKQLGRTTAFGEHSPVEVKLAAGKEIELYELKLYLGTGSEEGIPKYPYIFGTGKFQVQYEKVLGNSSSGSIKLDPALSKLATGKLELKIQPVAPVPQGAPKPNPPAADAPKPDAAHGGLRADVKPDSRELFNEDYAAIAVQSTNDVNFVLFYNGFLSSGITEWSSGKKWRFEGSLHLRKSQVAGNKVPKRVVALKYTSDAPATLFLDGKAYDLAAPNRVFVLRYEGEPLQTPRTHALRNEKDLVAIGDLAMEDLKNARTTTKQGATLQPATEQKLKWGAEVNGLRAALVMHPAPDEPDAEDKNDIFLVVQNVSQAKVWLHSSDAAPNPRQLIWRDKGVLETINEVAKPIPADFRLQPGEVAFFRMTHPPGKKNPGGRSEGSLIEESIRKDPSFSLEGSMEISTAPDGAWSGKLVSGRTEGGTAIPAVPQGETQEPLKPAAATPASPAASAPAIEAPKTEKPKGAAAKLPDSAYIKSGVPIGEFNAGEVTWSGEQNGLALAMSLEENVEWRVGGAVKVELWVCNAGEKELKIQHFARPDVGLRVLMKGADGKEHEAAIAQSRYRVFAHPVLLPAGHVFKAQEFSVLFLPPGGGAPGAEPHFTLAAGAYKFRCELTMAGADGKLSTPAEGEWTGTLKSGEVDVKLVATDAPKTAGTKAEAPKPDTTPAFLAPGVMPKRTHLFNDRHAAIAVQSEKDVNFVLIYAGALSSVITESSSEASGKWGFEGNVHLVDREKTKAAGKNVDKRVIAVKYTSDAPTTLFLDGKAYDLAAPPPMTPMGALEAAPGRVFLLRDEGEPFQTHRTLALRNDNDLATIGVFAVGDCFSAGVYAESRRVQQMEGWVLALDVQVPLRHSGGERSARLRIFPDGRVLSLPDGRKLSELKISDGELAELLRWLAEDQKVPVVKAQPGDSTPASAQEFDTWAGGMSFLQFKHNDQLHSMTVGSHLRNPGTENELANPGAAAFKQIYERLAELERKAVPAPEKAGADADNPAAKPLGAKMVKLPDDQYVMSGFPADELVGEGVMWNDVQNGLSLGYRITGDEWRILGKKVKVELWVQNPGDKDVKFQSTARPDIGLQVKLKDAKGDDHNSEIWPNDTPPSAEHRLLPPGHAFKVKEFTVSLFRPANDVSGIKGYYFAIDPGEYKFHCELELPGFSATGEGGKQLTPAAGEWTGKLTTRALNVVVVAPDAPAPKPRIEHADVNLEKDGTLFLNRKKVTLDELKELAAKDAKKQFTIRADKEVPYAKVIEVLDALKAAGVTEFSFSEASVGDGKYRVANRTGTYEFDDKHGFSICRPSERPQWFTVSWPAEGDRPACWLRTYPNVSEQTQGKWAVVWEPGTDVLWWVDDSDVGKMTLTDPASVIVDREGRTSNFSRDFGLPEEVKTEFRRLGFVIGRDKTPGVGEVAGNNTGGNSGEQAIVSAEFGWWCIEGTVTNTDGKPLANVPVRVSTNQEVMTEKTDAKGAYRVNFSLPLQLLAHSRAVTVKPVLEGFTERDMAKSGEFNVLLRAGEEPQHVRLANDKDFQPGPIPRFAERDLLPSQHGAFPGKPGRADFVMLKTAK